MGRLPDVERRQTAFRLFVRYRNKSQVSRETGIPVATLHVWAKEDSWELKLSDLQSTLQGQMEVLKDAQNDLVQKDMLTEMQLLEHLQNKISGALLGNLIVPTTWQDVIKGLEFINKEKRLILGNPTERAINHDTIDVTGMKEEDLDRHIARMQSLIGAAKPQLPDAEISNSEKKE